MPSYPIHTNTKLKITHLSHDALKVVRQEPKWSLPYVDPLDPSGISASVHTSILVPLC